GLSKPVTAKTLPQTTKKAMSNTNVLKPGMYRIDNRTAHTKAPQVPQTVRNTNPRVSTSTGVNHKPTVSRPQLKSNQSRDMVLPNNSQVKIVQLILLIVDSGCMKHMTGNLKLLCNFVEKFLGTVRFGNGQFTPILGYGDLVQGNLMINKKSSSPVITVRTDRGTEFLNKTLNAFFNEEGIEHQTSTARTPEQNSVVKRWNRTLGEAARTMLSASQLSLLFWVKRWIKSGQDKGKGDQCILVGYSTQSKGYRVYNKKTRMVVESIHIRFNEIKEVSETSVANNTSSIVPQRQKASNYDNLDHVPHRQDVSSSADADVPSQQELDLLFGPLYDEFFNAVL
nr:hypothetical protein [Tanacetum cinerariifolium]